MPFTGPFRGLSLHDDKENSPPRTSNSHELAVSNSLEFKKVKTDRNIRSTQILSYSGGFQ